MQAQIERIEDLIKSEVNIKEIEYLDNENGFIKKKIKPNFVALGKKLGPKMKAVACCFLIFHRKRSLYWKKKVQLFFAIENEP